VRQFFRALAYIGFCAFVFFDLFLTFDTPLRYIVLFPLLVSVAFYIASVKLKSIDYVSAAWLVLGTLTVLSFFVIEVFETSLGLVLLIVVILFFYDFTRYTYKVDSSLNSPEEKLLISGYLSRAAKTLALTLTVCLSVILLSTQIVSFQAILYYSVALVSFLMILCFAIIRIYSQKCQPSSK
jgi:Ca2+/Na+ antiporter